MKIPLDNLKNPVRLRIVESNSNGELKEMNQTSLKVVNESAALPKAKLKIKIKKMPEGIAAKNRQRKTAYAFGVINLIVMGVSLTHQALGVEIVSSSAAWESWSMAIAIDLGFVGMEVSLLTALDKTRKEIEHWAKGGIIFLLSLSALFNAVAFSYNVTGWKFYSAIGLGLAIPALMYIMTHITTKLYIGSR